MSLKPDQVPEKAYFRGARATQRPPRHKPRPWLGDTESKNPPTTRNFSELPSVQKQIQNAIKGLEAIVERGRQRTLHLQTLGLITTHPVHPLTPQDLKDLRDTTFFKTIL